MISLRRARLVLCLGLATLAVWGCGGDDNPSDPMDPDPDPDPTVEGTLTARVDGVAWTATAALRIRAVPAIPGGYEIRGTGSAGGSATQITINLYNLDDTGTFPLGVNPTVFGGYVTLANTSGQLWHSAQTGSSGSVNLTTVSASRIAGTFQFQATPFPGTQAVGTKVTTDGQFDFPFNGTVTAVSDNVGGKLSATLNGASYNASYVAVTGQGAGDFVLNTANDDYGVTFFLSEIDEPGDYPILFSPPIRTVVVNGGNQSPQGVNCCWGPSMEDTGTVTVTSLSADRIVGTFHASLMARPETPASEPLTITNGSFDLGLAIP